MHVILTILKILGILLLVILGLLLAIVLSVLFVPVRYQLEGEKPSPGWSEANGKIRVSWLLHLIHLRIQQPGERTGLGVLSFWCATEESRSGSEKMEKEEKKEKSTET